MGLLPLEFSDCLLDSPYYRENLRAHEKQLEQTSGSIKALIAGITEVLDSAKLLIKAKKALADTLNSCQFDCLGTSLTDDEILIASSLKQFARFLSAMEEEMEGILVQAQEKFITPLLSFRKEQIGSVKATKKAFEKATNKLCVAQDKYVAMSGKREESLAEASETLRLEQRNLNSSSLEYVYLMHVVQERKKFEFVEAILNFTQSWVSYYRKGAAVAGEQEEYMTDLKDRVGKTRDNFSATSEKFEGLKEKMLSSAQDPGLLNKMYTRQGYLFVQGKKNMKLGSVWTKYFCQYQAKTKTLTLIPYSQLTGKITGGESLRVTGCVCQDETRDKFRFSVSGEDLNTGNGNGSGGSGGEMVTYNVQALSEFERKHWVEALGGTWPAVNTLQRIRADSAEDNLNSCAFTFLKDCLSELESRGLTDQGLYRVGGVISKVKKLLNQALDPGPGEELPDMSDPKQWESKTLASAVKQYFRDLSKPLMTYQLYNTFLEAVKKEDEATRLNEIYLVTQKLPRANREILKVLIRHLNKVSVKSDKNLMTASNLGVVFGPGLLRPREETVASIMDIKFCNEVIAILIENCERFFPSIESSPEFLHNRRPSLESRSTAGTCSTAEREQGTAGSVGSSPAAASKAVKRTQSFSSFSQLSSASLPDIKEFQPSLSATNVSAAETHVPSSATHVSSSDSHVPPAATKFPCAAHVTSSRMALMTGTGTTRSLTSERPRSKSHQHEMMPQLAQPSLPGLSTASNSSKEGSPAPLHLSKAATQADLMASLEMMTSLAADLPSSAPGPGLSPLKRSYTLNPKRMTRTPGREVTRKPPLPKLSSIGALSPLTGALSPSIGALSPSIGALSPSALEGGGPQFPGHYPTNSLPRPSQTFNRQNSAPVTPNSETFQQLTSYSDAAGEKGKASRPTDLPGKLISAFEGICASPGQSRRAYNSGQGSLVIEEYGSREGSNPSRGHRFVSSASHTPVGQQERQFTNFVNLTLPPAHDDNGSVSSNYSSGHSPRGVSEDRLSTEAGPGDMLHMVRSSSPILYRNNVSHDSGVLTSPSPPTDSGIALMSPPSRHRHFVNNNNNNVTTKSKHHAAEDTVSVNSCSLSEASEASASKYDNVSPAAKAKKEEAEMSDSSNILENLTEDREEEEDICDHPDLVYSVRDSGPYENVTSDNSELLSLHDKQGLQSLRRILTNGQTTNV